MDHVSKEKELKNMWEKHIENMCVAIQAHKIIIIKGKRDKRSKQWTNIRQTTNMQNKLEITKQIN